MGDLIVLTPTKLSLGAVRSPAGSADILFFTGVRYYRMTEETMPIAPAPKRRRRASGTGTRVTTKAKTMSEAYELQA